MLYTYMGGVMIRRVDNSIGKWLTVGAIIGDYRARLKYLWHTILWALKLIWNMLMLLYSDYIYYSLTINITFIIVYMWFINIKLYFILLKLIKFIYL